MPALHTDWTVERALALPADGNRYEVLDGESFVTPALLLAVEVLSPSTARADRHRKRLIYQNERVREYWVVDCNARLVERWRPADTRAAVLRETLDWQPREDVPGLPIGLPAFFAEVMGAV